MQKTKKMNILESPNCAEAEEACLGSLIISNEMIPRVKAFLRPEAFYMDCNRIIYETILHLHDKRKPIDPVTLTKWLSEAKQLDDIGGPSYLADLIAVTPNSYTAVAYAQEVMADYAKRRLIDTATWISQEAYGANGNVKEIMTQSRQKIQEVSGLLTQDSHTIDLPASNQFYMDLLQHRAANSDRPKLKFNVWPGLNRLMPELGIGDLVAVLAESGVGKTTFLENCAEDWARRGWRVAYFHLELNVQTMLDRRAARMTGMPIIKLREPEKFTDAEWGIVFGSLSEIEQWPGNIHYVHSPGWTSERIVAKAIDLNESKGLDIIIVDYFNKIKSVPLHGMNYTQARGQDIETLKTAIEDYHWRGMLAGQFDKVSTGKKNKRGSDARDTAELEQKSNDVFIIERRLDENNKRETNGQIQLVKCNVGEEGYVSVYFEGKRLRFVELQLGEG